MTTISEALGKVRAWWLSWFSVSDSHEIAMAVLDSVSMFVERALPIVEAIDKELKPAIRTLHEPVEVIVERFLAEQSPDSDYLAARRAARKIAYLPTADMLVNVALFLLERSQSKAAVSILRLAIELAYNVYKASRSEAKETSVR